MNDLGERIKKGRELSDRLSQDSLAQAIGVSRAAVAQWESQKENSTKPSIENLIKIAQTLDVNIEWLITGTGDVKKSKVGEDLYIPGGAKLVSHAHIQVPVVEWNLVADWCAGKVQHSDLGPNQKTIGFSPSDPNQIGERCFAIIIPTGDESMRPDFNPGAAAICDPDGKPRHLSMVLVSLEKDQYPVIRQLIEYGKTRLLDTLNPRYPNSEFTGTTIVHATVKAAVKIYD